MPLWRRGQKMRGVEAKLFGDRKRHGIPIHLCVCTLSRQRGCSMQ
jgi:hypothetical protein